MISNYLYKASNEADNQIIQFSLIKPAQQVRRINSFTFFPSETNPVSDIDPCFDIYQNIS